MLTDKEREYQKQYRLTHKVSAKEYNKKYREMHKEELKEANRKYREERKDKDRQYYRDYYEKHRERIKKKASEYQTNNKERRNERSRTRRKHDIQYVLSQDLRNRINAALRKTRKETHKTATTAALLGCSLTEFKEHLEKQFLPGMTWENKGLHGWHIDHKIPCCKFDLTKSEEQAKCFHYTNLQPLWAEDNLRKGGKYPHG